MINVRLSSTRSVCLKMENQSRELMSMDCFFFDEDDIFNQIVEEEHLRMKFVKRIFRIFRKTIFPLRLNFVVDFNHKVVYQRCSNEKKFGEKFHLTYKFIKNETKLVKKILDGHGFEQLHPSSPLFNLLWTSASIKICDYQTLLPFQRVNHFPKFVLHWTRKTNFSFGIDRRN